MLFLCEHALDKFKDFFEKYTDNYVLIGGTACSVIFDEIGQDFRATKDLDIVLIIENLGDDFADKLWNFIKSAGYKIEVGQNKKQFYRFSKPLDSSYPKMIELFSRNQGIKLADDAHLQPLHISDDISNLSSILLNDDYYNFLIEGKKIIDGISVLDEKHLIPFKAKAWCELTDRRNSGDEGQSKHIKKHYRDIYRLSRLLVPNDQVEIKDMIRADMERFINNIFSNDNTSADIDKQSLYDILKNVYLN